MATNIEPREATLWNLPQLFRHQKSLPKHEMVKLTSHGLILLLFGKKFSQPLNNQMFPSTSQDGLPWWLPSSHRSDPHIPSFCGWRDFETTPVFVCKSCFRCFLRFIKKVSEFLTRRRISRSTRRDALRTSSLRPHTENLWLGCRIGSLRKKSTCNPKNAACADDFPGGVIFEGSSR